jgi:pimeloyl-ACP methyl ester carboxylesterase
MKTLILIVAAISSISVSAGKLTEKIAQSHKVITTDKFYGFDRTRFEFQGCEAWVVEPSVPAIESRPWTWTMQWATAFVPRTPALHLLRQGWHHVTIDTYIHKMNDKGLAISKAYQEYLVKELGLAPKACLIGLSWGGFFSTRYAATNPENIAAIYYDCPLMNFDFFRSMEIEDIKNHIGPWGKSIPASWTDDPRMPINMAEKIAKAKIPVYLVYGGADRVVPPATNCELFAPRFKAAGGDIKILKRRAYGHHPHGVEVDDKTLAEFFIKNTLKASDAANK